ncbi:hypothetical protein [Paucibacter sp. KBW04]|uniref:hypothetical protein n=1 Tax=Paucibacter sp. KBW04 TaxID=2153361 RepID=UPI000F57B582|nr:hypothetical protein [Paucibacter sp. KBW04]
MSTEMKRSGWSVSIKRRDGTEFLCCGEQGILPPVWPLSQRRFAVAHKRNLLAEGFRARVVRVEFTVPVEASQP